LRSGEGLRRQQLRSVGVNPLNEVQKVDRG
jgi:hypothetical protein